MHAWSLKPIPVPLADVSGNGPTSALTSSSLVGLSPWALEQRQLQLDAKQDLELRWFARLLLEGKVQLQLPSESASSSQLNSSTRKKKKKMSSSSSSSSSDAASHSGASLWREMVAPLLTDPPALLTNTLVSMLHQLAFLLLYSHSLYFFQQPQQQTSGPFLKVKACSLQKGYPPAQCVAVKHKCKCRA